MSTPKHDVEELMNSILPLAKRMLAEEGEFFPYGGYMDTNGKITHVGAQLEGTDHPKSQPLIDLLRENFRKSARNGEVKATAIVFDVRIKPPGEQEKRDAIQVCLDHEDDYSVEVLFPYIVENGQVIFGRTFAQRGKNEVFGSESL